MLNLTISGYGTFVIDQTNPLNGFENLTTSDFGPYLTAITSKVNGLGPGSVTSVSVITANGISGIVTNPTTTPAITLALGAITPTSVAAVGAVTGSNLSGTNTGDQTITLTGDVTGSGTGSFVTTVVTNANLTGDVTSIGNASTITTNIVSNSKLSQMAAHTFKGNNTGSTANALDLTATQLTAELNLFSSTLQGLTPLSGGGTSNYLRADG